MRDKIRSYYRIIADTPGPRKSEYRVPAEKYSSVSSLKRSIQRDGGFHYKPDKEEWYNEGLNCGEEQTFIFIDYIVSIELVHVFDKDPSDGWM